MSLQLDLVLAAKRMSRILPWRVVLFSWAIFFGITAIPVSTARLVDLSACRTVPSVLFPGERQCPTYTQRYRGGVGVFDVSVSSRPTGTTTSPGAFKPLSRAHPGFHWPSLLLQLVVVLAIAVPVTAIVGFIASRARRSPSYGAVRRRSRLRGDL